jgi:uncharacterized protein
MESAAGPTLGCRVLASSRQSELYVYLRADLEPDCLPDTLTARTGALREVMTLDLHVQRPLARVDVEQVMRALCERGYFIQLPPNGQLHTRLYDGD